MVFPIRATRLWIAGICALAFCALSLVATTQNTQDEETTRKLWDTAFSPTRRKPARSGRNTAGRGNYRVATPRISPTGVSGDSVVGVTVWRLRPSREADEGERIIVHEGSDAATWIPERVPANAGLSEGDRVRLSVEVARTGYLYVIDREQYADGTLGEPYLIFPTTRTLGGDNQVKAGRLVDIPAQEDSPPFFTLKRSRADQVGELLSIIVTPVPLAELEIGATAQKLSVERVALWEKSWGEQTGRLELGDGVGKLWTREEKEAGASAGRLLKAAAPNPQTLYYLPGLKSDKPLLIKVQLQYHRRKMP
ncbi:MAG TPA: DUF4384 domain-containing protein, partial [Pyrinomonadaceae bacterium]|nr:DUF4384 domain-containing protein [Pyrinomonadaceae bacterium]